MDYFVLRESHSKAGVISIIWCDIQRRLKPAVQVFIDVYNNGIRTCVTAKPVSISVIPIAAGYAIYFNYVTWAQLRALVDPGHMMPAHGKHEPTAGPGHTDPCCCVITHSEALVITCMGLCEHADSVVELPPGG